MRNNFRYPTPPRITPPTSPRLTILPVFVVVVVIAISEIISHCSLIRHDNIEPKGIVEQTSETEFGSQRELKSQYLSLTLNSLSTPNLTLYFGTDLIPQQVADFRKALSIFDIVVSRNTTNGLSVPFDGHINFNGVLNIDDCDVLFEDVARFVVGYNSVSTSAIQRRYDIGYMRAKN